VKALGSLPDVAGGVETSVRFPTTLDEYSNHKNNTKRRQKRKESVPDARFSIIRKGGACPAARFKAPRLDDLYGDQPLPAPH